MDRSRSPELRLTLVDISQAICGEWATQFSGVNGDVSIRCARFEEIDAYDALLSPGNSFGVMDGGIDAHIVDRFPSVHQAVRAAIDERFHGYQPVGTAMIVATGDPEHPFLVHAPTMRVPGALPTQSRPNVHDAFWAALVAIERHNAKMPDALITHLATPGLGTGVGRVPPEVAARLMALAYRMWRTHAEAGPRSSFEREASLRAAAGL